MIRIEEAAVATDTEKPKPNIRRKVVEVVTTTITMITTTPSHQAPTTTEDRVREHLLVVVEEVVTMLSLLPRSKDLRMNKYQVVRLRLRRLKTHKWASCLLKTSTLMTN